MSATFLFQPDYAFPPGDTLLETLEFLGISQTELAARIDCPIQTISQIITGAVGITANLASHLETFTGVPASFWNMAEANFQENRDSAKR